MQQLAGEEEAVAEVSEVGVDAELPGVAEGPDNLGLLGQVLVAAVLDVTLVDEGLKVGAGADAVGRVDVDHLHLAGHALLLSREFMTSSESPAIRRLDQTCACW